MRLVSSAQAGSTRPPTAGRVACWLLDLGLAALIFVVVTGIALGRIIPLMGDHTYMISSGSMSPAIPVGAAVVVDPHASRIAVGDVISVHLSGTNVYTHRVSRIVDRNGETWYETKGDSNPEADPAIVPASSVIGRVVASIPLAGYLLRLMSIPSGIALLLGIGGMLIVASWLVESTDEPAPVQGPVPSPPAIGGAVEAGSAPAQAHPDLAAVVDAPDVPVRGAVPNAASAVRALAQPHRRAGRARAGSAAE